MLRDNGGGAAAYARRGGMEDGMISDEVPASRGARVGLWTVALVAFSVCFVATAWQCDDAYITYRTVENFVEGKGLRWQAAERVQSYTHPLWMLALIPGRLLTGELYFSSLALSYLASGLTIIVLLILASRRPRWTLLSIALLLFSQAFMDFSSSGMENPLSHLLAAAVVFAALRPAAPSTRAWRVCLFTGLSALNRIDTVLLFGPLVLVMIARSWNMRTLVKCALAFSPLVLWEAFSIFYYGFPFPNTAYAKALGAEMPMAAKVANALGYFEATLQADPLTLVAIWALVLGGLLSRSATLVSIALGVVLYQLYLFQVGGDYMRGRFFSVPLVLAVALGSGLPAGRVWRLTQGALTASVILTVLFFPPPLRLSRKFGQEASPAEISPGKGKVVDSRAYYYPVTGLMSNRRRPEHVRAHAWYRQGEAIGRSKAGAVVIHTAGFIAHELRDDQYAIDILALCDPLLARLPPVERGLWPAGHMYRKIPDGYIQSVMHDRNEIRDPGLRAYYDVLRSVTRGPLFSTERFAHIWQLNTRPISAWFDPGPYVHPRSIGGYPVSRHYEEAALREEDWPVMSFGDRVVVHLDRPLTGRVFRLRATTDDAPIFSFLKDDVKLGEARYTGRTTGRGNEKFYEIRAPDEPWASECNAIRLFLPTRYFGRVRWVSPSATGALIGSMSIDEIDAAGRGKAGGAG